MAQACKPSFPYSEQPFHSIPSPLMCSVVPVFCSCCWNQQWSKEKWQLRVAIVSQQYSWQRVVFKTGHRPAVLENPGVVSTAGLPSHDVQDLPREGSIVGQGYLKVQPCRYYRFRASRYLTRKEIAVAELFHCSPPTKVNRVRFPAGSLPGFFARGDRAGRFRWSAGFLGDLPFPPPLKCRLVSDRRIQNWRSSFSSSLSTSHNIDIVPDIHLDAKSSAHLTEGAVHAAGLAALTWVRTRVHAREKAACGLCSERTCQGRRNQPPCVSRQRNGGGREKINAPALKAKPCTAPELEVKGRRVQYTHEFYIALVGAPFRTDARFHHRGSKLDPRSTQKTVVPFEFRAGLEIKMKFISNRRNWRFQNSIRDQQPTSKNSIPRRNSLDVSEMADFVDEMQLSLLASHQGDLGSIPGGSLRIFASGNRAELCRWSAGFLGDLPFPLSHHSGVAPYSAHFTLIGSQDLADKNQPPNLFTRSLTSLRSQVLSYDNFNH
ncbi:hypothetical protein PR048_009814 [Dryococelus australis]|uniref:Uncharacterized protein n=1 Tax=Dryococelus australis TaxID=614101 RepID=A0ABQ9I0Z0_9NEOP|nr:hypothetical protein PR048_009814 [Dryococelus australis]